MNWYKMAFPIIENKPVGHYTDIGHSCGSEDYLWNLDTNWNFKKKLVENGDTGHYVWEDISKLGRDNIAAGRYESFNNRVSLSPSFLYFRGKTPQARKYIISKISKILDKEFNNPEIMVFD